VGRSIEKIHYGKHVHIKLTCDVCGVCEESEDSEQYAYCFWGGMKTYEYGTYNKRVLWFCSNHRDAEIEKAIQARK
jgi:D-arabinose 1-dehydrogenase-like Zn-dependent alcohol dehydrogenase